MKSTLLLVVGVAVGALGSAAYLHESRIPGSDRDGATDRSASGTQASSDRPAHKSLWPQRSSDHSQLSTVRTSDQATNPGETTASRPRITNTPRPLDDLAEPTLEQLQADAEAVQQRATVELARLARLLDLSEEQQDRIFPLLARSSTAFHPALAIQVGTAETTAPSKLPGSKQAQNPSTSAPANPPTEPSEPLLAKVADEEIHQILTPAQQEALEDAKIDEDLWWSEVVAGLESELEESSQIATGTTDPAPETVEYTGNTGIGALLQQAAEENAQNNVTGGNTQPSEPVRPGLSR